jgi:hypothetical protein
MFLPLDASWAIDAKKHNKETPPTKTFVSPATIGFKLLITWLYWDAGHGKYSDELHGWTFNAQPLPALDTYVRHTVVARYMYGLLGPTGLRYMTPTVPYAEMFSGPLAIIGSYLGSKSIVYGTVALMFSMHIGIALTMRNTVLLSSVACVAWCIFLPESVGADLGLSSTRSSSENGAVSVNGKTNKQSQSLLKKYGLSAFIISTFIAGSFWFELYSAHCNQSMEHVWSTLLHNRWNVFIGAEECK